MVSTTQNKSPNFLSGDKFYLVKCFVCDPEGRENFSVAVASGQCAWCGWNYYSNSDGAVPVQEFVLQDGAREASKRVDI